MWTPTSRKTEFCSRLWSSPCTCTEPELSSPGSPGTSTERILGALTQEVHFNSRIFGGSSDNLYHHLRETSRSSTRARHRRRCCYCHMSTGIATRKSSLNSLLESSKSPKPSGTPSTPCRMIFRALPICWKCPRRICRPPCL
jgi:hypothetical protein